MLLSTFSLKKEQEKPMHKFKISYLLNSLIIAFVKTFFICYQTIAL